MDRQALTVVGTVGDVNPLDYGGGVVYRDLVGVCSLEYYEPNDEDDEDSPITCWRVDLDHGAEEWMDLPSVAVTHGQDAKALASWFESENPMDRASAFLMVAQHHGWDNLDQYPLTLTRAEAEERLR